METEEEEEVDFSVEDDTGVVERADQAMAGECRERSTTRPGAGSSPMCCDGFDSP